MYVEIEENFLKKENLAQEKKIRILQ